MYFSKKFTELIWTAKKNPNTINISIQKLSKYDLIEKEIEKDDKVYKPTELGNIAFEISERVIRVKDINKTLEDSIELARRAGIVYRKLE